MPWLEAAPVVQNDGWAAYLAARSALVGDLAADIDGRDLPALAWSSGLYSAAPELAREVAVWRAATGCRSDPTPCGPADCEAPAYRRELAARVDAVVDVALLPGDRWRALVATLDPRLCDDTHWPWLARAIDDASRTGYDVENRLPRLVHDRPLPAEHAARALTYRLADDCPESVPRTQAPPDAGHDAPIRRDVEAAQRLHKQPAPSRGRGR